MDMLDAPNPLALLEDYPVQETKALIKQLKDDLKEAMDHGEEQDSHIEILLCAINSLDKELEKVKKIDQLSKEKQARVIADTCLILQFLQSQNAFDEDFDEDDESFEEDEEEDEEEEKNRF